ncbi:hypothetical protein [Hyalangium minutum]|uniref:hypothetical protein n=1 Tax=Hyalangium minutum TaxID=394096 RepID=UPI0005C733F4|nr:hypothetical protein [Hyalangium minutum]
MTSSPTLTVVAQTAPSNESLFTAFREERTSKVRWLFVLLVPLLGLLAAWGSMHGQEHAVRIVTAHGFKMVQPGMSQADVVARLGNPIGKTTRADGAECVQYGVFSVTEPSTNVYVLCYVDGVLQDVTTRRYSLWTVDPSTGEFMPAGVPMEEEPAKKPAPVPTP